MATAWFPQSWPGQAYPSGAGLPGQRLALDELIHDAAEKATRRWYSRARRAQPDSRAGPEHAEEQGRSCCRAGTAPKTLCRIPSRAISVTRSASCCRWRLCSPSPPAMPVVKVGRIAGQFAKPRSEDTETQGGVTLPSIAATISMAANSRRRRAFDPDQRLLRSHRPVGSDARPAARFRARAAMPICTMCHRWMLGFIADSPAGEQYEGLAGRISGAAPEFMAACGVTSASMPQLPDHGFLLLPATKLLLAYEQAMASASGSPPDDWYDTSAHMLWIGDRTRQLDGAHVEFMRGIKNRSRLKCGPSSIRMISCA